MTTPQDDRETIPPLGLVIRLESGLGLRVFERNMPRSYFDANYRNVVKEHFPNDLKSFDEAVQRLNAKYRLLRRDNAGRTHS